MTHHHRMSGLIIHNVSRRDMLKGIAGAGGLVLAAQIPGLRPALAYPTGAEQMPNGVRSDPHIFLSIAKDGTVTIVAARAEMGTGAARTTLPTGMARECPTNLIDRPVKLMHHHRYRVAALPGIIFACSDS